ncbi:uncharacterized protein FFUJ_14099 [Fusarium fujikuroi IMI 58289]|uniref:Uncharacterized protein n=1 Tax=Gibberella fujikuroi (strain CBS 195.34 / IMI 58289 / NRRL A-6831) TaxID=1279085 RepID=S0EQ46_GIBF5|nr:uncharacterized protein FFUJ_14099 [Fusarium fujikuroi IMI 58289]CCT76265.1 uncharacterized protein FFUJ_14099 [Fusarium fujikuroi IMI 58289]SCO26702.1 uncharacterized protein FFM5_14971 [Fusarium fujikuroi]SCO58559.1 uncharacterized protein FFMR_15715 [Fusarium fujikuroi]
MEPGLKRHVCQPIIHGPNGLLEKSPESTLTVEKLLEIDNKPPAPDPSEMNVPKFSFCSDCVCRSYGIACSCVGEGSYLGTKVHFEMIDTVGHWEPQPVPIDRSAPRPSVNSMPVTGFIKTEAHDLRAYLGDKLSPQHRATTLSYNDKYAKWVYGEVMAPNATFSFHFKFRNSEAEVEASAPIMISAM